jgi:hypothetical protein
MMVVFGINNHYAQNYNQFRFYEIESNFAIEIGFYPSNVFYTNFIYYCTDDVIMSGMMSIGKYRQNGDSIIFIDELSKNKYVIVKEKGKYICKKVFKFMNGKEIQAIEGKIEEYRDVKKSYEKIILIKQTISSLIQNNSKINSTFKSGLYLPPGSIEDRIFYLTFNKNGSFLYIIDSKILLEGKWEIKGSLLILKDNNFPNPFYLQIKNEKELIGLNIPGNTNIEFKLYQN